MGTSQYSGRKANVGKPSAPRTRLEAIGLTNNLVGGIPFFIPTPQPGDVSGPPGRSAGLRHTKPYRSYAMTLLGRYLEAIEAVEEAAVVDASGEYFDAALAQEVEAEAALLQFVKLANRQDLARPVQYPVAAVLDGTLVVVTANPDDAGHDMVLVVRPRNIAWGE
jgi:hypothetical protein